VDKVYFLIYKKVVLLATFLFICLHATVGFAYLEDYPPFKFDQKKPPHINATLLVDEKHSEYKSVDGRVAAKLVWDTTKNEVYFVLKSGQVVLKEEMQASIFETAPFAAYMVDINGDGILDFIVFSHNHSNSWITADDNVEIFLGDSTGEFESIFYRTKSADVKDFVDLNNDGKYKILRCLQEVVDEESRPAQHTYWHYNIYGIHKYKMINENSPTNGFPKFIWFTEKPSDEETTRLTTDQRKALSKDALDIAGRRLILTKSNKIIVRTF